jgi:aryl-alcohol dehydrogenase
MKINAAVIRSHDGDFVLEELELDPPGPGEILVKVAGVGICHTDSLVRIPGFFPLPIVMGHEGSGVVEAIGPEVDHIAVGDHVVMSFDSCGACHYCGQHLPSYCTEFFLRNSTGSRTDGTTGAHDCKGDAVGSRFFGQSSFATHAIATARNAVVVNRDLPLELMGPLGCGVLTGAGTVLNALDVRAGSSIAVFGAGALGLSAIMAAKLRGAKHILAIDRVQGRLDLALELGATAVIDGAGTDLAERMTELTGGLDHAVDTTGVVPLLHCAIAALRPMGTLVLLGMQKQDLPLGPMSIAVGKTIKGVVEGNCDPQLMIPELIGYWREGRFPFDRLVRAYPLSQINEAFAAAHSGEVVKPVLIP